MSGGTLQAGRSICTRRRGWRFGADRLFWREVSPISRSLPNPNQWVADIPCSDTIGAQRIRQPPAFTKITASCPAESTDWYIRLAGTGKGTQFMRLNQSPSPVVSNSRVPHTFTVLPGEAPVSFLAQRLGRRSAIAMLCSTGLALAVGGNAIAVAAQEAPPSDGSWNDQNPPADGEQNSGDETTTTPDDSTTDESQSATDPSVPDAGSSTTTDTGTDTTTTTTASPGSGTGSGNGQAIADFAMQFQGDAYVAAGRAPGGFDCSGFTCYVVMNTMGIDIGGSPEGQVGFGSPVEFGAWEPGDLVFFANTFRAGVSHVGIAIGGSQMIHAENESSGVTISDITSDYYTSHYSSTSRL